MDSFKTSIKNRHGLEIVILVYENKNSKGLAFVAHGLGGFKEQPHIQAFVEAFFKEEYTVVTWDATNSIGESGGKMENATLTNFYEDFQDIVEWAKGQSWYKKPFIVCGHSLGAMVAALYAEDYPKKVKGLAPISVVVSGKLTIDTINKEELAEWKRRGYMIEESKSKPGITKRLNWHHVEDRLKYNLLLNVDKLIMPVLLIVGDNDPTTTPDHHRLLFEAIPGNKELHVIKGAEHTFRTQEELSEIKRIIREWVKKISNR